jgi:mannonate dehydratase
LERVLAIVDSPADGLTWCCSSLGADTANDITAKVREFTAHGRISFTPMRNFK